MTLAKLIGNNGGGLRGMSFGRGSHHHEMTTDDRQLYEIGNTLIEEFR